MACPYAEHAPETIEASACWAAGMAGVRPGMASLEMDMAGALAAAREMGATGWPAAEWIAAFASGMRAGAEKHHSGAMDDQGGGMHGR
jgi:hypothetical protein